MTEENILLIEIGTEELPSSDLQKLSTSFQNIFAEELKNNQLEFSKIIPFATPRRLALKIFGLPEQQPGKTIAKKGPSLKDAFDGDGKPTNAALGFATSCNTSVELLQHQETETGAWLYFEEVVSGLATIKLIPELLEKALSLLPIAKRMRWGTMQQSFVRPVHWLVILFNEQVVEATLLNIKADRYTHGHRFHAPFPMKLQHANDYEQTLAEKGKVIPDFNKRSSIIKEDAQNLAKSINGQILTGNEELLDLITALVEFPIAMLGTFNEDFLTIPKEVLIAAIQEHQKCLTIVTDEGKLINQFILVSNIESNEPEKVVSGNELVVHARLADADFLFKEDQKHSLEASLEKLKTITFQNKLGSLYDKTLRIEKLAVSIAEQIDAHASHTARAAKLCKIDLTSQMVYEFPELQGIMGYYYSQHDGEPSTVSAAIQEHYLPKTAQDSLPLGLPSVCVAIADRIDTLVGLFAIDKIPSGEKDPFALKRQALAILRIIIEKSLSLDLQALCKEAYSNYESKVQNVACLEKLADFFFERLRYWYLATAEGSAKVFESVLAKRPSCPFDFYRRLTAVQAFQTLSESESLAAANKRVKNILTQTEDKISFLEINSSLFEEKEEEVLCQATQKQEELITPLLKKADYQEVLKTLSTLKEPVDLFFDKVMVMTEDPQIRHNRLNLLRKLQDLFLNVADISLL